jgi:parallel beta-helix repeat protein
MRSSRPRSRLWFSLVLGLLGSVAACGGGATQNAALPIVVDPANKAGWSGNTVDAWIAAASASLGSTGGTVQVLSGSYTIAGSIQAESNVFIQCDPSHDSVLTASASLTSPLYVAKSVSYFGLSNCVMDGDAPATTTAPIFMAMLTNATGGIISNNIMRNTGGFGIYLAYGNSYINISGNEIFDIGQPLPSFTHAIGAGAQAGGGNSHIAVLNNYIHDGNLGILLLPSTVSANVSEDWLIAQNTITKMSTNGISIYCSGIGTNGPVRTVRTVNNEVSCVGWPANGTGFDPACVPGEFQAGPFSSPDGTGVSYNCATEEQGFISSNRLHDNFFEGIDLTPIAISVVNTGAGGGCGDPTSLCWVGGDLFLYSSWQTHQSVLINGLLYAIASCSSSTNCTLEQGPGNLTRVTMISNPMRSRTTVTDNTLYGNGHGNAANSGNGGADVTGYQDVWSNNVSYDNNAFGFVDFGTVLTSHSGEQTFKNDFGGGLHAGIECSGCLEPRWNGIVGYDTSVPPQETVVAQFDNATYGGYMCDITAIGTITAFIDDGTDDVTNCVNGTPTSGAEVSGSTPQIQIVRSAPGSAQFSAVQLSR